MAEKFLRLQKTMEKSGLCRSAIYALEGFPKPVKIGGRAVAWVESEIDVWIADTIEANRNAEAKG